jgi:hypothetical protein
MALVSMVVSEVPVSMVVISMAVVSMVAAVTVDRYYFSRINNQESDIVEFRPLIVVPIAEVKRIVNPPLTVIGYFSPLALLPSILRQQRLQLRV